MKTLYKLIFPILACALMVSSFFSCDETTSTKETAAFDMWTLNANKNKKELLISDCDKKIKLTDEKIVLLEKDYSTDKAAIVSVGNLKRYRNRLDIAKKKIINTTDTTFHKVSQSFEDSIEKIGREIEKMFVEVDSIIQERKASNG